MSTFTLTAIALDRSVHTFILYTIPIIHPAITLISHDTLRYRTVLHPFSTQATSIPKTIGIILCIDFVAILITLP